MIPRAVFELNDCPITDERVVAIWRDDHGSAQSLLPLARRCAVPCASTDDECDLRARGRGRLADSDAFLRGGSELAALWWMPDASAAVLMQQRGTRSTLGASFAQVNAAGGRAACYDYVLARGDVVPPASVIDGYSGAGRSARGARERGRARVRDRARSATRRRMRRDRLPAGSRSRSRDRSKRCCRSRCRRTSSCSIRRAPASMGGSPSSSRSAIPRRARLCT